MQKWDAPCDRKEDINQIRASAFLYRGKGKSKVEKKEIVKLKQLELF